MTWTFTELPGLPDWARILVLILDMAIRIALLGIVPGNRRPSAAMAWLLIIFFMPVPGLLLFWLLGSFQLGGHRRRRQKAVNEELRNATKLLELPDELGQSPPYVAASAALTRRFTGFPMLDGNKLKFITGYRESMRKIAEDIDSAQEYVHVCFYIMAVDPPHTEPYANLIFDALERAQARGVKVRLLFDHIGSLRTAGYRKLIRRLKNSGIEYYASMPIRPLQGQYQRPDLRNHRKLVVIDGTVAYTGSQNLIEPGYKRKSSYRMGREWVDLMARITGPMVASLDIVFATDWAQETEVSLQRELRGITDEEMANHEGSPAQVIPSGPGFRQENNLHVFNHLFYNAKEQITVVSPYLVPDDSMQYALTNAVARGVDVRLIVSRKADQFMVHHAQQSYYEQLLRSGVRIFRYPDPNVLHSKLFTVDDEVAVFGSSNMDMRSFSLNLEVTMLTVGPEMVAALDEVIALYMDECTELTYEEWLARPRHKRWLDNVFRLTSALQ